MNKEKLTYVSPETETLVVRFEGVVRQSPNGGFGENPNEKNQSGSDWGY